jgi:hypothetical protein
MDKKSFNLQKQIMDNSKNVNEYFTDLFKWEKEINQRDKILENQSKKNPVKPYKLNEIPDNNNPNKKKKDKKKEEKKKDFAILKRDTNNMKDYYKEWDKFNVDEELSSSSEEETNQQKSKIYFYFYFLKIRSFKELQKIRS